MLKLIALGNTYGAIAAQLHLAPASVRSRVLVLRSRLGVGNNVALVLAAVAVGLLSADVWPVELTGLTDFDPLDLGP